MAATNAAKIGRPTLLTDELRQAAMDYIENYQEHKHVMPSVVGMAIVLNIAKSTLYAWADDEAKEFSDTLEKCNDYQEHVLLNNGLTGAFNPTITKLALANHGYSDRSDNTLSGPDGGAIPIAEVQRVLVDPKDTDS